MTTPNVFQTVSISKRCYVAILGSLRRDARFLPQCSFQKCVTNLLWPVYTGDFCCEFSGDFKRDFAAISNRPCKLLAIPQRYEIHGRFQIANQIKIASVNGPLEVSRL